jgi:hypothetical protein
VLCGTEGSCCRIPTLPVFRDILVAGRAIGGMKMKVHLRCNSESRTIDGEYYGISQNTTDRGIKSLLSEIYELPLHRIKDLVIDRNPDGIVVRPPAVFG